jgi:type IV secretory pathway VirB2 component (pilin)
MRVKRVLTLTAPLLLYGTAAFCATSGTPLDTFFTTIETTITGPVAGLIGLLVLIAAAGMLAIARNFEHGFQVLLAGGGGVALLAGALTVLTTFWPTVGALIR